MMMGCSGGKPEPVAPVYEDGKLDSAKAPASTVDLTLGETVTARFTARSQYRAFRFDGVKGQKVSIYADGVNGLDTVVYLYRATTGPTGRALATNDDTADASWTQNPLSSSLVDFVLPSTRSYAVVATTWDGSRGSARVTVDASGDCDDNSACAADQYCAKTSCRGPGTCAARPELCYEIYQPVCGCDGKTWSNTCSAAGAGVSVAHSGACADATP